MKDEKKDFVEVVKKVSDIVEGQVNDVGSYIAQLNSCVEKITADSKAPEKNADTAAAATYLLMRLNLYKFNTKVLSVISRKLERFVHDFVDECLDALEIPKN